MPALGSISPIFFASWTPPPALACSHRAAGPSSMAGAGRRRPDLPAHTELFYLHVAFSSQKTAEF